MSRFTLLSLAAIALLACSTQSEPEVVQSAIGGTIETPTIAWAAKPGPPVISNAPFTIESAPAATDDAIARVTDSPIDTKNFPVPVEDLTDGEGDPLLEIEVRPGESLVLIADWSGLTVEDIADANGIRSGATLYPGQLLEMGIDSETFAAMQDARERFEDTRLDRYLERRGSLVGVTTHTVGTGETAWQIGREHGELPLWVVASFNRGQDLDRLRIGQELSLPMLGDTVAWDDEPTEEPGEVQEPVGSPENRADSEVSTIP
jgi:LysM repeat protein